MLPLEEAQARLLALGVPRPVETVGLNDAPGRFLGAPLVARLTQPPADVSAMDGWAVRHADIPGPWAAIGTAAAGRPFDGTVAAGQAVRIFTGAVIPTGADTVMVQEDMRASTGRAWLAGDGPTAPGAHIRRRGQDFRAGATLMGAGARLTPAAIGLAAAAGHARLCVHARPRIVLISTGTELVAPGGCPAPGQIIASAGAMLAALLGQAGAVVADVGIVPDDMDMLVAALDRAASDADIVVTIGGASVGDHDLVRPACARAGATLDFWRIAIRPGKPLLAGRLRGAVLVGLPGNPVSAYVCAVLLLLPLVRALAGATCVFPIGGAARVSRGMPANGARRDFLRARLERRPEGLWIAPFDAQDSSMLAVLAQSDALIVRPENADAIQSGEMVDFLAL